MEIERPYSTTNETYGAFLGSPAMTFTQSTFGKQIPPALSHTGNAYLNQPGKIKEPVKLLKPDIHANTEVLPFMTNLRVNRPGGKTNIGTDMYSNCQGVWNNSNFNASYATFDQNDYTYSNLQGAWSRVTGPDGWTTSYPRYTWRYNRLSDANLNRLTDPASKYPGLGKMPFLHPNRTWDGMKTWRDSTWVEHTERNAPWLRANDDKTRFADAYEADREKVEIRRIEKVPVPPTGVPKRSVRFQEPKYPNPAPKELVQGPSYRRPMGRSHDHWY